MTSIKFKRITSIDMLRGLVILLMLLDHVRETFFLHLQLSDPIDVSQVSTSLFINRTLAHICAPSFVFLAGISAYLFQVSRGGSKKEVFKFLFKRGIFLIVLELTLINYAWTGIFPPKIIYLQVIWAIGISMVILSVLLWIPRKLLFLIAISIIVGHNLLDSIHFNKDSIFYIPWSILHDRGWIEFTYLKIRTSYPILPWIGVISLGYSLGWIFNKSTPSPFRRKILLYTGILMFILFMVIRYLNFYGEKPWEFFTNPTLTWMSFFNITKYPPSFLFLLLTLSLSFILLYIFELISTKHDIKFLETLGSAPMFFYILHLYVLKILYILCVQIWGYNQGEYFGFKDVWQIWVVTICLAVVLYPLVQWFSKFKKNHKEIRWLKYL
ncbi:DUF1624 domain-containing protein [Apibacter muscae]|uniref:DUF1624 domain-containing protein n=1 Tax=Apibacter muscae TaxID=2509004 RepID=UPI0011AC15CC|nr:heparan-alpha-glucosaminide N-acetyltransferase domain-containing protein [Apibacter muscae]TWP29610.1 DUF1624 domain-containing protein [Apibacter muscae]